MSGYRFSILSPGGKAFEGDAQYVSAPGVMGGLGVLAGHAPMIAAVQPGLCTVKTSTGVCLFYTGNGVLEVSRDEVLLLVDEAQAVENADKVKELLAKRKWMAATTATT